MDIRYQPKWLTVIIDTTDDRWSPRCVCCYVYLFRKEMFRLSGYGFFFVGQIFSKVSTLVLSNVVHRAQRSAV